MTSPTAKLRLVQVIVILIFIGLGLFRSVTAPFNEGPDEVAHFQFSRFWAKYGYLPLTPEERAEAGYKSDWPPLFHFLAGLAGRGINLEEPPLVKVVQNNPRLQLVVGLENVISWRALTTEDPFQGEVLLWYLGRWITLLCGLAGAVVTYGLIQQVYPGQPWLALSATALLTFLPLYLAISSVISYEPLLGVFIALYFGVWYRLLQQPERNGLYLVLGLLMGLAGLTKYTPLTAAPLLPLFILWLAYREGWRWQVSLGRLALAGLGLLLTFGVWTLYTAYHLNRVAELGWVHGLAHPFLISDGSDATSLRLAGLLTGKSGGGGVEFDNTFLEWFLRLTDWGIGWFSWVLLLVWAGALLGLIWHWRGLGAGRRLWVILLGSHLVFFTVLLLLRFVLSWQAATGMGQHILFPAGAATMLLTVEGLRTWLNPRRLAALLWGTALLALGPATAMVIRNNQPPWPIQSVPLSDQEQALATFGELALLNYHYQFGPETLEVTLQWRAEALMSEDYRVEVTLVDGAGQPQVRWLGQPLNGRYPTRALAVGDRLRDQLYLPIGGLPAGRYEARLKVFNDAGPIPAARGESFPLTPVDLTPGPSPAAAKLGLGTFEVEYTLWERGRPAPEPPLYRENATVTLTVGDQAGSLPEGIQVKLAGPDGRSYSPSDQLGPVYHFNIKPGFASGPYRLRLEQWQGDGLVAQAESPVLLQVKTEVRQFALAEPISQPLSANFAGYISLLGYDLPQRHVEPGGQIPLTLHWQALRTIGAHLIMFSHLIDEKQQVWGGRDRVIREVYSTMLWAPEEIVVDPFTVQVDPEAPDGIYYLLVGLYLPVGESSVSVPLLQDGALSEVTHIRIGPVKVGRTPPGLTVEEARPQVPLHQVFGQPPRLTLLGYDLDRPAQPAGDTQLKLYWQVEAPIPKDYTTFVHIRNAAGETVLQQDQPPLQGLYPTSLWSPGEIVLDEITLPAGLGLPEGEYQIVIGLYDFQTGQRLETGGGRKNEILLTGFKIGS